MDTYSHTGITLLGGANPSIHGLNVEGLDNLSSPDTEDTVDKSLSSDMFNLPDHSQEFSFGDGIQNASSPVNRQRREDQMYFEQSLDSSTLSDFASVLAPPTHSTVGREDVFDDTIPEIQVPESSFNARNTSP